MIDGQTAAELWRETDGPLRLRIASASMAPLLRVGDLVEVVATRRPRVGDVLVFHDADILVVHRLITRWPWYVTRGDASRGFDRPIGRDRIVGTVIAVWRDGVRVCVPRRQYSAVGASAALAIRLGVRRLARGLLHTRLAPLVRASLRALAFARRR